MWGWVKDLFNVLARKFKKLLKEVCLILLDQGAALILDVTRQAVIQLANSNFSDEDKHKEVFKMIAEYAGKKGIGVKDSVINSVIELVLQEIKSIERGE